jgi:hypothetical protein
MTSGRGDLACVNRHGLNHDRAIRNWAQGYMSQWSCGNSRGAAKTRMPHFGKVKIFFTISFSGLARMDYSLLGNNVLKDHSYPDFGADLRLHFRSGDREANSSNRGQGKRCEYLHEFSLVL